MDAIGERVERGLAHPGALPIVTALVMFGAVVALDLTNFLMSYATVALLLMTLGRDRRDRAALHAKLDALITALPEPDDAVARLEERPEAEIEETRP